MTRKETEKEIIERFKNSGNTSFEPLSPDFNSSGSTRIVEDNKYYTPSIEEFHVGFRYESGNKAVKGTSTEWTKSIIEEPWEIESLFEEVRVKYLDQEDIEELGWEYSGKTQHSWFYLVKTIQPYNLTYRSFKLSYNYESHRLMIWAYEYDNFSPEEETLFLGECKNYNQLQDLMKMIGM